MTGGTKQKPKGGLLELRYRLRDLDCEYVSLVRAVCSCLDALGLDSVRDGVMSMAREPQRIILDC